METVRKGDTRATQEIFVERLIELALQGEGWAVKEVLERMDGKVSQKIEQDIDIRDLSASITFGKKPDVIDVTPEPGQLPQGEGGLDKWPVYGPRIGEPCLGYRVPPKKIT